jgi:signal transduction histidine kinase
VSIRFKVILPYLLLTLIVAITGVYVVTRLVANSLNERLTNQLLEAGRVVSDDVARQEIKHVETARIVAFTRGLAEALIAGERDTVASLAKPVAAGLGVENLVVVNAQGQELLHLIKGTDGGYQEVDRETGAGRSAIVKPLLDSGDPEGLPRRGLGLNQVDGRYYYYTAIPVPLDNRLVGAVVVGTSLDTLLPYLKTTSLADIIVYGENGEAIAATLGGLNTNPTVLKSLSIPTSDYTMIIGSDNIIIGDNFAVEGRWYSLARGSLRVSNDRLGAFGVVLPLNFVLQAGAVSRNTYVVIFTVAMTVVVLLGYFISRPIINPLYSLVKTSQAIAGGDLDKRTGIRSSDEIGMLANTFDDMTQRLQERTAELEKSNRTLAQMDRTKVRFIEVSAHELRTPLTLIKGYTQMVQQKANGDADLGQLTKGILDGTERMAEIVNSMLDVSKIDSNALRVVRADIQVDSIIGRLQRTFQASLEQRNLTMHVEGLACLPLIQADPDLLYKVFYHLIINAIKYTPDGGMITVSGRMVEEIPDSPEVEIAVCDTGVGIDPEDQPLVFEKFYQTGEVLLHSSGKTKFKGGGPGLGLAIARGIVEAHRGRIWVESPGYNETTHPGSQFHVRLPVKGKVTL